MFRINRQLSRLRRASIGMGINWALPPPSRTGTREKVGLHPSREMRILAVCDYTGQRNQCSEYRSLLQCSESLVKVLVIC